MIEILVFIFVIFIFLILVLSMFKKTSSYWVFVPFLTLIPIFVYGGYLYLEMQKGFDTTGETYPTETHEIIPKLIPHQSTSIVPNDVKVYVIERENGSSFDTEIFDLGDLLR